MIFQTFDLGMYIINTFFKICVKPVIQKRHQTITQN